MDKQLLELVQNKKKSLISDPLNYAMDAGVVKQSFLEADPNDPKNTLSSLAGLLNVRGIDAAAASNFFGTETPNITANEATVVADALVKMPQVTGAELGLLSQIHPQRQSEIISRVSANNPTLGFAMAFGREDPVAADMILRGNRKIDSQVLKQNEQKLGELKNKIFSGLDTVPDDYKNQTLRAALAYSMETGMDSMSLEGHVSRLSKVADMSNGVERYKTILPLGFQSQSDFTTFVQGITLSDVLESSGTFPAFVDGSPAMGGVSMFGDEPESIDNAPEETQEETMEDLVNKGKLIPVGDGKYEVHVFGQPLKDSKNLNNNFVLDIYKTQGIINNRTRNTLR